jgi:DNA-binding SARP family transcriptional activator
MASDIRLTRSVQELLAYLVLQRHRPHSREILADLFWGNRSQEQARSCLSTALWRLRRALEPTGVARGTYLVTTQQGEVGFNADSPCWLDVALLEQAVQPVVTVPPHKLDAAVIEELEKVIHVYTGELLDGFYDEWVLRERERLRLLYLSGQLQLMRYYRLQGDLEQSARHGQDLLRHDPLREDIHRELMHLYLENGQRARAAQQYESCRRSLAEELGILPMEETQLLYARILSASSHTVAEQPPLPSAMLSTLSDLHQALVTFENAYQGLQHSIRRLEQLLENIPESDRGQAVTVR